MLLNCLLPTNCFLNPYLNPLVSVLHGIAGKERRWRLDGLDKHHGVRLVAVIGSCHVELHEDLVP
jgi:hypothetical protein